MSQLMKICAVHKCPRITDNRYCPEHESAHDRARGTKTERGYGKEFQAERRMWVRMVATGEVNCWRCLKPILPGTPFDLGHDDLDRTIIRGPEHSGCNRSAAGKASHG